MNTLQFKTNIKCNGCIQTVTPYLSRIKEITEWKVDLTSLDRTLTVEGIDIRPETIISELAKAGYRAEVI
jgi:copper chaperone